MNHIYMQSDLLTTLLPLYVSNMFSAHTSLFWVLLVAFFAQECIAGFQDEDLVSQAITGRIYNGVPDTRITFSRYIVRIQTLVKNAANGSQEEEESIYKCVGTLIGTNTYLGDNNILTSSECVNGQTNGTIKITIFGSDTNQRNPNVYKITYTQNSVIYINESLAIIKSYGVRYIPPVEAVIPRNNRTYKNIYTVAAGYRNDEHTGEMWKNDIIPYFSVKKVINKFEVGFIYTEHDLCVTDNGAPLFDLMYPNVLIGVGVNATCGTKEIISKFVEISRYSEWINRIKSIRVYY